MFKVLAVFCILYLVVVSAVSVDVSVHVEDEAPQHHVQHHDKEVVDTSSPAMSLRKSFHDMINGHSAIFRSAASAEVDDANNDGSAATIPIHYTNCGRNGDIASNLQILVSSWPPKSGADLTVKITGNIASDISGGHWQLQAKVFFFNINKRVTFLRNICLYQLALLIKFILFLFLLFHFMV